MNVEIMAKAFREEVLALAGRKNAPSDVVVIALADVLGITAALLDRECGHMDLNDRLDTFCARVEETYQRVRNAKEVKNGTAHLPYAPRS